MPPHGPPNPTTKTKVMLISKGHIGLCSDGEATAKPKGQLGWHRRTSKRRIFLHGPPLVFSNTDPLRITEKSFSLHHRTDTPYQMYSHTQQAPQPPQLLVDGYISIMLGPLDADAYHSALLRRGAGPLQAYTVQGYPLSFRAVPSPVPGLEPPRPWVVDYVVLNMGTVIPQQLWVPPLQREFLCPPIFFFQRGRLGLPLNQAVGGNLMYLDDASRPAPLGANCGNHAQIRLHVSCLSLFVYRV